ncbi:MAG: PAS domain-containing hybrid sensor histidine kinase/response regulator [Fibrobacterota bacterium]
MNQNEEDRLRKIAEEKLKNNAPEAKPGEPGMDLNKIAEELSIHQIELEHQNLELKSTLEELQETQERYRGLYMDAPAAYITVDADNSILEANREAAELFELPLQSLLERKITSCLGHAFQDIFYHHLRNTTKSSTPRECELRLNTARRPWVLMKSIRRDAGSILSLCIDISSRKEAEQKLTRLFNNSANAVIVVDRDTGTVGLSNPKASDELAIAPGQRLDSLFPDFRRDITIALAGSSSPTILEEIRYSRPEGREKLFRAEIIPIDEAESYILLTDITERATLHHIDKMQSIAGMAGGLAHDYNNILHSVGSALELIEEKMPPGEDTGPLFDIITEGLKNAENLNTQLMDISERHIRSEMSTLDIHQTIDDAIHMADLNTDSALTIQRIYKAEPPAIQGNPVDIKNLFINLLINAKRACRGKESEIRISTRTIDIDTGAQNVLGYPLTPGRYIEIDVTDTGTGISPDTVPRIFDPFFSENSKSGGTGLGLSRAYGICRKHKGHISVKSKVGAGTVFHVYLPLDTDIPEKKSSSSTSSASVPTTGNATLLIVDDENTILMALSYILKKLGYTVITTDNPHEALSIYDRQGSSIDLVILDMIMPEMSGEECFYALRKKDPYLRILIHSGFYEESSIQELFRTGNAAYIKKPATKKELHQKIQELLQLPETEEK